MKWDFWITRPTDNEVVMLGKTLLRLPFDYRIHLHKILRADAMLCFHTHPAWAIRVVLWGGCVEEICENAHEYFPTMEGVALTAEKVYRFSLRRLRVGHISIVRPAFCHRLHRLLNGSSSYSLWLRGPVVAPIFLRGSGWPVEARERSDVIEAKWKTLER